MVLSWVHIGDLHVTRGEERNHGDLREAVAQANRHLAGSVDFALLPGDNANEGTVEQYRLIVQATRELKLPLRVLPGDHDFEPRDLAAFHDALGAVAPPLAETIGDTRCLFLDVVSAGAGGADFRLGAIQLRWLEQELETAEQAGLAAVIFMHVYPSELRDCAACVAALLLRHRVAFVAMGHTHYNELSNDGRTIYAAVRSTGQVEEGPPGFALTVLEDGIASWRFKELARPWPFCLITAPADERLITDPNRQTSRGSLRVRARAWNEAGIAHATCRVADGPPRPMTRIAEQAAMSVWAAEIDAPDGPCRVEVEVEDGGGSVDRDVVTARVDRTGAWRPPARAPGGSDENAIGIWPEKGIQGGQLGPNKNGKQW